MRLGTIYHFLQVGESMKKLSQKSEEHKRIRRKQIFDAAVKLFSKQGFHKTTLEKIAKAAGISKATIYLYAKSKNQLLYFLVEEGAERHINLIKEAVKKAPNSLEKIREVIKIQLNMIYQYWDVYRVVINEVSGLERILEKGIQKRRKEFLLFLEDIVRQGIKEGVSSKELNPRLAAFALLGITDIWTRRWISEEGKFASEEVIRNSINLYLFGIAGKREEVRSEM